MIFGILSDDFDAKKMQKVKDDCAHGDKKVTFASEETANSKELPGGYYYLFTYMWVGRARSYEMMRWIQNMKRKDGCIMKHMYRARDCVCIVSTKIPIAV